MNPRVSRSSRAGVEGHRLPDRQDRRQAGRRLPAGRAAQRHHPRDAGLLRADDRLRRHQDPALRLREIPRGRPDADHADEERRRDDGHRPHVQGVVAEGAARPGDRPLRLRRDRHRRRWRHAEQPTRDAIRAQARARPTPSACASSRYAFAPRPDASTRSTTSPASTPGSCASIREIVDDGGRAPRVDGLPTRAATRSARPRRIGFSDASLATLTGTHRDRRSAPTRKRLGVARRLQARRHLRRRVRGLHAVLLLDLRGRATQAPPNARARPTDAARS